MDKYKTEQAIERTAVEYTKHPDKKRKEQAVNGFAVF